MRNGLVAGKTYTPAHVARRGHDDLRTDFHPEINLNGRRKHKVVSGHWPLITDLFVQPLRQRHAARPREFPSAPPRTRTSEFRRRAPSAPRPSAPARTSHPHARSDRVTEETHHDKISAETWPPASLPRRNRPLSHRR